MSSLEARYRRLLAFYPTPYRHVYEAEMLTTLMDGAADGQRSPRPRESFDLLWNALRLRLHRDGVPRARDPRWSGAAAVFGALAAMLLGAANVKPLLGDLVWQQHLDDIAMWGRPATTWPMWTLAGWWALVAALALTRWRRAAAGLAWTGLAAAVTVSHLIGPLELVVQWPLHVLAATCAICLSRDRAGVSALSILGGKVAAAVIAVVVAVAASSGVQAVLARVVVFDGGFSSSWWGGSYRVPGIGTFALTTLLICAAFAAVAVWIMIRVGPPIRRRLVALAAAPAAMFIIVNNVLIGGPAIQGSFLPLFGGPASGHGLVLLLSPPLIFAIGLLLVRHGDGRERLIELGRAHLAGQGPPAIDDGA